MAQARSRLLNGYPRFALLREAVHVGAASAMIFITSGGILGLDEGAVEHDALAVVAAGAEVSPRGGARAPRFARRFAVSTRRFGRSILAPSPMKYLRRLVASWPVAALLGGGALAAQGCQSIVGIHDVSLDPSGGGGGATSGSMASMMTSGGGGASAAGFAFAVKDALVNVPYAGLNYVNVEVTPSGGFAGAIDVTVQGAPTGLVTKPLTIAAGSATGRLEIGAQGMLTLGTKLTLTLAATSGAITRTATVSAVVTGKPGDLDLDFNGGVVAGPVFSGWAGLYEVQELAAGKIVAAGMGLGKLSGGVGLLARYLPDGTLDTSFNTTGTISPSFCGGCSYPPNGLVSVARELDGKLLFAGSGSPGKINNVLHDDDIFLFRFRDNGALDAIQGDTGVEDIDLGGDERVTAAKLVPKSTDTVVVGSRNSQLMVAKIPDRYGNLDTAFAAPNGYLVPAIGGTASRADALALDPQGRIVVTGSITTASGDDVVILRLTPDGALDPTFGKGGFVILPRLGDQSGSAVILQPDGAIVVAGATTEAAERQLLVQRFLASGDPDPSFGAAGVVLAPLGKESYGIFSGQTAWMVPMLDGRLVVAGNGTLAGAEGPVFARFLPDGSPDPTFGANGELVVYVGMNGALGGLSMASDGKLLLAGTDSPNPPGATFLARIWN